MHMYALFDVCLLIVTVEGRTEDCSFFSLLGYYISFFGHSIRRISPSLPLVSPTSSGK
jgi:hypothetical protein